MNTQWLQARIYCQFSSARVDGEGDRIIQECVRPTFDLVTAEGWVESRYFRRFSGGGDHIEMRFLGDRQVLLAHVRPFLEKTIPCYLQQNFPPPSPESSLPQTTRYQKLNQRFGHGQERHPPYTFAIGMLDNVELLDPLLTPLQRAVDDLSAMVTIALLSETAVSAPQRYLWALLASGWALRPLQHLLPLAPFCENMSAQWFTEFAINPEWRHLFAQKYARSGPRLTHLLGLDWQDARLTAVLGNTPASTLARFVQAYNRHIQPLRHRSPQTLSQEHLSLMAAATVHLLHNRLGLTLEEELFTNYLLARFFAN